LGRNTDQLQAGYPEQPMKGYLSTFVSFRVTEERQLGQSNIGRFLIPPEMVHSLLTHLKQTI